MGEVLVLFLNHLDQSVVNSYKRYFGLSSLFLIEYVRFILCMRF